jgi:hypothetical protein
MEKADASDFGGAAHLAADLVALLLVDAGEVIVERAVQAMRGVGR